MTEFAFLTVFGFGQGGWGPAMLAAAAMTIAVAMTGFVIGAVMGVFGAWAKIGGGSTIRAIADGYTTVFRGIPDLLVIYLFYFGSSSVLTPIGRFFGAQGFLSLPSFLAGALAIAIVSGAYHTEIFRGSYKIVARGEVEAARATGMSPMLAFRRVIAPLTLRFALPGLGNIWQLVLKESSLISVTGLIEILRQAEIGAGSVKQPFTFYLAAAILYMLIASASGWVLQRVERHFTRGLRRA